MYTGPASARESQLAGGPATHFSPERALEAIDDRWGLLVLQRAIFQNARSFEEFRTIPGITEDVLDARLTALTGAGLLERESSVVGQPPNFHLTARGRTIEPVILALASWRDSWSAVSERSDVDAAGIDGEPTGETGTRRQFREPGQARPVTEHAHPVLKAARPIELSILGGFSLRIGGEELFSVPLSSQRIVSFLGIHSQPVSRSVMASKLWPDASEVNAGVSLRSALSRLDSASRTAVLSSPVGLSLQPAVSVDLRVARSIATRLMQVRGVVDPRDLEEESTAVLSADLFPDLYEDWAVAEADDWHHRRVHALERQSELLFAVSRFADAAGAARAAIKAEPLRESPYALLIRTYLAAGNQSQALKVFDHYSNLLSADLQLEPTILLSRLVENIRRSGI